MEHPHLWSYESRVTEQWTKIFVLGRRTFPRNLYLGRMIQLDVISYHSDWSHEVVTGRRWTRLLNNIHSLSRDPRHVIHCQFVTMCYRLQVSLPTKFWGRRHLCICDRASRDNTTQANQFTRSWVYDNRWCHLGCVVSCRARVDISLLKILVTVGWERCPAQTTTTTTEEDDDVQIPLPFYISDFYS